MESLLVLERSVSNDSCGKRVVFDVYVHPRRSLGDYAATLVVRYVREVSVIPGVVGKVF